MELGEVIRRRRMVRAYDPDLPVPAESLDRILRHATRAPSAGFSQGWDLLVLTRAEDRELFWSSTTDGGEPDSWLRGVRTAPCLVVCLSDPGAYLERYAERDKGWTDRDEARWPVPYWDVDTGMAAMLMLLTAVDEGLGALFFGVPVETHERVRAAFGIPQDRRFVGVVALGHPAPDRRSPSLRRGRRPLAEVVHHGRFGTAWPGTGSVSEQAGCGADGQQEPDAQDEHRGGAGHDVIGGEGPQDRARQDDQEGGEREEQLGAALERVDDPGRDGAGRAVTRNDGAVNGAHG